MPPMKSPVKNELWNFLITIVPPTDSIMSISVDHTDANASGYVRVETVQNDRIVRRNVTAKIVYLFARSCRRDLCEDDCKIESEIYPKVIFPGKCRSIYMRAPNVVSRKALHQVSKKVYATGGRKLNYVNPLHFSLS